MLTAQKKCTESSLNNLHDVERRLYETELKLSKLVGALEKSEKSVKLQRDLDNERAVRLARLEKDRAKRYEKKEFRNIEQNESAKNRLFDIASTQINVAKSNYDDVARRLQDSNGLVDSLCEKAQEDHDKVHKERVDAVLSLKDSMDNVSEKAAAQSMQVSLRRLTKQKQFEDEKERYLAKGVNPYEAFRQQTFEDDALAREMKLLEDAENKKNLLSTRLTKEDKMRRREDDQMRRSKEYEKKFRDELGRNMIEKRNHKYMDDKTIGHETLLDPSGRSIRINPSQVTDIADNSFGLGKSSRIPEHIRSQIIARLQSELKVLC